MAGTPLSKGEGPVHVESQEAFWRQQPSSFLFRGDVRAWRGENLLLAPELRGDREADQLVATGGVKTLWFPTPEQQAKAANMELDLKTRDEHIEKLRTQQQQAKTKCCIPKTVNTPQT